MPTKPLNATEAWVRENAPELLEEENLEVIAPFIKANDLNGLAHFLEQRIAINVREDSQSYSADAQHVAKDFQSQEPLDPSQITKQMQAFVKEFLELFKKEGVNVELAADWLLDLLSAELALDEEALYDESPVNDDIADNYRIEPTKAMFNLAFKCQEYLEEAPGRILPAAHWLTREVIAQAQQEQALEETNPKVTHAPSQSMSQTEIEQHAEELKHESQILEAIVEQANQDIEGNE